MTFKAKMLEEVIQGVEVNREGVQGLGLGDTLTFRGLEEWNHLTK